tara:strand:- start:275 stop:520 length:246 start_codon:yes stop_codon:yes gene_type:complete
MNGPKQTMERIRSLDPKYFVGGAAVIVLLLFVFQNTDDAHIEFLWFDMNMPLFLLLLLTVALTWLVVILAQRFNKNKRRDG